MESPSSILTGVNFIVTIHAMRAQGSGFGRLTAHPECMARRRFASEE
jgi:hypothetical protein